MDCPKCGTKCETRTGNISWTSDDGIEVVISGTEYTSCNVCHVAVLPPKIKNWLEKVMVQKREIGGRPYMFLNAAVFAHS
jgi:hypothetical protein